jgi:hypothetical protein
MILCFIVVLVYCAYATGMSLRGKLQYGTGSEDYVVLYCTTCVLVLVVHTQHSSCSTSSIQFPAQVSIAGMLPGCMNCYWMPTN